MKRLILAIGLVLAVEPAFAQMNGVAATNGPPSIGPGNTGYNPYPNNVGSPMPYNPGFGGVYPGGYPMGYPVGGLGTYSGIPGQPFYYPAPVPVGGANFNFRLGGMNATLWHAPSGYYYPFRPGVVMNPTYFPLGSRIIFMNPTSNTPPEAKLPPLSVQFSDTLKFLEDAKKDKKISDVDYTRLRQRTIDIQRKERSYRIAQGGALDTDLENEIRRDLDNLANEIAERVKQD